MRKTLGYMVTFTTYGTWLQGDERGWVKDGAVYEENPELHKANERRVKGEPVRLRRIEREIVREAICRKAESLGEKIFAVSVWSNHVHIVLGYNGRPIEETVRIYKNVASAALKGNEFKGRIWTRGFDKRFCFDENSLKGRIKYVEGHKQD
jgi:REP element-mobilizing transposase RayT